jgi:hypothetical protein
MEPAPRLPRVVSEGKRERDVYRLYSSCFKDIRHLDPVGPLAETTAVPQHVARPAKDSALTAFAQLAAIRLGASRSLISLIDDKRQHILAEATPSMSVRFGSRQTPHGLWLGNVSIPRTWGVCENVLSIDPAAIAENEDAAAIIINDLAQSDQHAQRTYVTEWPKTRFYAGVPLTSPAGAIVGALCIFDDSPRDGLPRDDIFYMHDLAATIMEYLDTYTLKEQFKRGEQLTRGLVSFVEGRSVLQPFKDENRLTSAIPGSPRPPANVSKDGSVASKLPSTDGRSTTSYDLQVPSRAPSSLLTGSTQQGSVQALQNSILPANSKTMFARAANIVSKPRL